MVVHKTSEKKPAIVLDIGNAFTKAGYVGDDEPICIVPSKLEDVHQEIWLRDVKAEQFRSVLRKFLRRLYLRHLLVSMGERTVIVCEPLLRPQTWKNVVAQVLLLDFEVPAVVFAPRHLMSLYTLGINTALVIHSGYSETLVLPIYENLVLLNSCQSMRIGGQAIEENLHCQISETGKLEMGGDVKSIQGIQELISPSQMEDIKVRTCFITSHDRAETLRSDSQAEGGVRAAASPPDIKYPLQGDAVLHIPGRVRETVCEIMYNTNDKDQNLARLVLDTIAQCPIDTRRRLAANIVLIGGNTMLTGYKHRLQKELMQLSKDPLYPSMMSIDKFAFHNSPVKENYAAWLGGSIFGACGRLELYAITRDEFQACNQTVPDWSTFDPSVKIDHYDSAV